MECRRSIEHENKGRKLVVHCCPDPEKSSKQKKLFNKRHWIMKASGSPDKHDFIIDLIMQSTREALISLVVREILH